MSNLFDAIERSVRVSVEGRDVAVAFSGGLDSAVVAAFAKTHADGATLYTVGAHDSYDVKASRELSAILDMDWIHIPMDETTLEKGLRDMISVTGTVDPVTLSFEVPLMCILPFCREEAVIGGQGADEVFWGYSKYVGLDESALREQVSRDFITLNEVTLVHERRMAEHHGKTILYPYLDEAVIEASSHLPFDDMVPIGDDRKRPLREVAMALGHPEIASKPKKAAQYGTGSMNMIRRLARRNGLHVSDYVLSLKEGVL